jgi:signal transduction histidine kinase
MVRRSLVFKIGLSVSLVFFACVPLTLWVGNQIKQQGRHESIRSVVTPQLEFIASEVERSLQGNTPTSSQLEELGRVTRHRIRFVPWTERTAYPSVLTKQSTWVDLRTPGTRPHHWVRIDFQGHPFGALEVSPLWGGPDRRLPSGALPLPERWGDPTPGDRLAPPGPPGRQEPPMPPRMPPPVPGVPEFTLLWLSLLGIAVVPPLWLWVIRPLKSMVGVARRLGSGDLETAVAVRRDDEFGELERAFEGMRLALRQALLQRERLLTDVSHEIRGPLTRMTLALPLLKQEGVPGAITDLFGRELEAVNAMLGDVLALARGRSRAALSLEPLDMVEVARGVIAERAIVVAHRGVTLVEELDAAPLLADEKLLARAMGNLLDNALKYTPSGGCVTVKTGLVGTDRLFRVDDDGPGIAPEHLPMIFEPFYRPDDSRSRETGGTGLGLSIVREIASTLGGTATIHSTLGQGTRAEMTFPAPS